MIGPAVENSLSEGVLVPGMHNSFLASEAIETLLSVENCDTCVYTRYVRHQNVVRAHSDVKWATIRK